MDRVQSILVGVDFSKCSFQALIHADWVARRNDATLHIIHVLEDLVVSDLAQSLSLRADELREQMREQITRDLQKWLAKGETRSDVSLTVVIGSPLNEILHEVKRCSADLLVLGVSGASGSAKDTGALATKCVRKAATKVMLVRETHTVPFKRVMACVDFSEISGDVIDQAMRVATLARAELHLLHVFSSPWSRVHYMAPTRQASPDFQAQYRAALNHRLEECLEEHRAKAPDIDIKCQLFDSNSQWQGIVEYAKMNRIDLAVLGTRGRGGLKYVLLGSTAERVLTHTPCSVLAIKPRDFCLNIG
jgi:nucleotide-binding universal stress UspA family protein